MFALSLIAQRVRILWLKANIKKRAWKLYDFCSSSPDTWMCNIALLTRSEALLVVAGGMRAGQDRHSQAALPP
jgi:hypothetical protein